MPGGIGIGGDSAGGNLALAALLRLRDLGETLPRFGALVYGMLSANHETPSHRDFGDGRYGLSTAKLDWFWTQYLPDPALRDDPQAAPLTADLGGLPPLLLLAAALDPLLDDTLTLDRRLTRIGARAQPEALSRHAARLPGPDPPAVPRPRGPRRRGRGAEAAPCLTSGPPGHGQGSGG